MWVLGVDATQSLGSLTFIGIPLPSPLQLVRTCARYHDEQKKMEERSKKEEESQLRQIASSIAREVDLFWSNIEQV